MVLLSSAESAHVGKGTGRFDEPPLVTKTTLVGQLSPVGLCVLCFSYGVVVEEEVTGTAVGC